MEEEVAQQDRAVCFSFLLLVVGCVLLLLLFCVL